MSNPFAVAAVTATFAQLLGRVIEEPSLAGATVSTGPPDAVTRASKDRQLNLFLYEVTPNPAWRNVDLPIRNSGGAVTNQPVLAIDLHYLVTAYGQGDDEIDAQHLLAQAMSIVHDNAVLTPAEIRAAQAALPAVALSDLADQVDLVRICPQTLSIEELSKVWGMFQTTNYRLSTGYQASAILVERPRPTVVAPPVRQAILTVLPIAQPVVELVSPAVVGPGGMVAVVGRNFLADDVQLRFGAATAVPTTITGTRLEATLPAALRAGVNTVQVLQRIGLGSPPQPHRGFESNIVPFVLAPRLATATPVAVARGSSLSLDFAPLVGRSQRLSILVGDREVLADRPDPVPPATSVPPASTADFPIPADIPTGDHLLRLRVDGAESALEVDDAEGSPTFGQYVGPIVTVTP